MAIEIKNTSDVSNQFIKVLVHAPAGAGKTRLCDTTGTKPLIISVEGGLLSLKGANIDYVDVKTLDELRQVYAMILTDTTYDWVCLDSLSEVAETVLAHEKKQTKDPRKAYGEMQDTMLELIRCFRDLPKNIYMSAKQKRIEDTVTGALLYNVNAPGQNLAQNIPYFFDEVFTIKNFVNPETNLEQSFLQTKRCGQYECKDRSGALEFYEPANLAHIAAKIRAKKPETNQPENKQGE